MHRFIVIYDVKLLLTQEDYLKQPLQEYKNR